MKGMKNIKAVVRRRKLESAVAASVGVEAASKTVTTRISRVQSFDSVDEAMRLRGGCGCLVGGVACDTGPCICATNGHGILGTLACCIIWPLNAILGFTLGILNCLTCGCCGRHQHAAAI